MSYFLNNITQKLVEFVIPGAAFVITVFLGYGIKQVFFRRLGQWSKNTKTQIDDIIIAAVRGPFIVWFIMLGIFLHLN